MRASVHGRSVRELWLPPSWTRATLTQPRQDYTRMGTRKGERASVLRSFSRPASSTCARFIPRELYDGEGFVGLEKISEKTSGERGGGGEKKSHEQLLSLSVSFPRVNTTLFKG